MQQFNSNDQPQHGLKDKISIEREGSASDHPTDFRFGRMFPKCSTHPMVLRLSSCADVGARMTARPEIAREDSMIPAGYTYFGQFVDHDITMDTTIEAGADASSDASGSAPIKATPDPDLVQSRSPSLDLDSVYGTTAGRRADLMSGFRFRIGTTFAVPGAGAGAVGKALPNDLPRNTDRKANIADPRNDENLAVGQMHLLWLKFHNAVADKIVRTNPGFCDAMVFECTRDIVTRHYQYVVLHDFLPRFLDVDVFQDIIVEGNRKALKHSAGEAVFMPLEFSVAAYRFGHSQVRQTYDWNRNFGTPGAFQPSPGFEQLFEFSGGSGTLGGLPRLASNWIADFRRLFDMSEFEFPNLEGSQTGPLNMAKKIDPYLAPALAALPGLPNALPFSNLAALNLRRGSMRALPSGQDISRELSSVRMLSKAQMQAVIDPDFSEVLDRLGFFERTPLWLYCLLEARATGEGEHLGGLGSTIVADTFRTLALTSRTSILHPNALWTPEMAQDMLQAEMPLNSLPRILAWLDQITPVVDPLQDSRNA